MMTTVKDKPNPMRRALGSLASLLAATAILGMTVTGCAERDATDSEEAGTENASMPGDANEPLTVAEGWTVLTLDANSATTKVKLNGHYETDKNMCQKPGASIYDLKTWNSVARTLNEAVSTKLLSTPRCVDSPNGSRFYNRGIATLSLENNAKRQLFEYKNGQICSSIEDAKLSERTIALIEKAIELGDRADATQCPNYRP